MKKLLMATTMAAFVGMGIIGFSEKAWAPPASGCCAGKNPGSVGKTGAPPGGNPSGANSGTTYLLERGYNFGKNPKASGGTCVTCGAGVSGKAAINANAGSQGSLGNVNDAGQPVGKNTGNTQN